MYKSIAREQEFYDVGQDKDRRAVYSQDQRRTMAIRFLERPDSANNMSRSGDLHAFTVKFLQARQEWYERTSSAGAGCWI